MVSFSGFSFRKIFFSDWQTARIFLKYSYCSFKSKPKAACLSVFTPPSQETLMCENVSLSTLSRVLRTRTELWVRQPQSRQWRDGTRRVATRRAALATEWLDKLGLHWDCLKTGRHSKIWLWHSVCNFRDGDCCPWCRRKVLVLHYCTSNVAASVS